MNTLFVKSVAADPDLALSVGSSLDRQDLAVALDLIELEALQEQYAAGGEPDAPLTLSDIGRPAAESGRA